MIIIVYTIIILIATTLGAIAGLGGGVIIKPVLDLIGYHDINTISFISTIAVFSMSIYAVIKRIKNGIKIDWMLVVFIAVGSIIGGIIGNNIFNIVINNFPATIVTITQAIILDILLIVVLVNIRNKTKSWNLSSPALYIIVGLLLGIISSFLGIGGGPINVAVFIFCFSVDLKKATIYSLVTILFSQGAKLFTIGVTTGFMIYDLSILIYVIPTALLGGIIGSKLNRQLKEKQIEVIFNMSVIVIIVINIIVLIKNLAI